MTFIKLLKRWFNMLTGKSVFHVKQGVGKYYSKKEVCGYYNDLTGKVSEKTKLDKNGIPITTTVAGVTAQFPIAVFQYGLGLYDSYLEKNSSNYLKSFLKIADWAVENIDKSGMWDCMGTLHNSAHLTQSSMCQSEGASLLIRAYLITKNELYLDYAKSAINFMIKDVNKGGTCVYDDDKVIFQEYVSKENLSVLNGWIFSIFGLYDIFLITKDKKYYKILQKTLETLSSSLNKYDRSFWTNYDQYGTIASPAYHDLHIMQLKVLYDLFEIKEFKEYYEKWELYQSNRIYKLLSMFIKFFQKIKKSKYYDINTSTIN